MCLMMKKFTGLLALILSAIFVLAACQPNVPEEDNKPNYASYSGYSNIPDLGALAEAKSQEKPAAAAAERLSVDPDAVFVYSLKDLTEEELKTWTEELEARGFEASGSLEEGGNTVSWYSDDRKIGLVAGYMDTDKQDGMDSFGVLLVSKSLKGKYVDLDYESVQEGWGNANNGASFFIDDKKIFGYGYIASEDGFLSKNTDSSNAVMLVEGQRPRYVHEWDKTVYAALPGRLVAVNTKEKDPEEAITTLADAELTSLQIVNEKLYYTTKNGLYHCDLDGENTVKVTGQKMNDAYLVGDKVFYRDTEDENTEHAYSLLTEADTRVTETAVSGFFLGSKNYGYYITQQEKAEEPAEEEAEEEAKEEPEEEAKADAKEDAELDESEEALEEEPTTYWALMRVNLKDGVVTELATVRENTGIVGIDGRVYYVSDEQDGQIYSVPKKGGTPKRVARDKDCSKLMTFHDMLLYYDYDDETEEGLEHIYISTTDGFMKSDILR